MRPKIDLLLIIILSFSVRSFGSEDQPPYDHSSHGAPHGTCISTLLSTSQIKIGIQTHSWVTEDIYRSFFDLPDNELCLKNTPERYKDIPGFRELAYDPDRKLITPGSIREAMAILELGFESKIALPITRGPLGSRADYFDGDGNPYDVKAYSSKRTSSGFELDPKVLGSWIIKKLRAPVQNSKTGEPAKMMIVLDQTWLTRSDSDLLDRYLGDVLEHEEHMRIIRLKLPEPMRIKRH